MPYTKALLLVSPFSLIGAYKIIETFTFPKYKSVLGNILSTKSIVYSVFLSISCFCPFIKIS